MLRLVLVDPPGPGPGRGHDPADSEAGLSDLTLVQIARHWPRWESDESVSYKFGNGLVRVTTTVTSSRYLGQGLGHGRP